MNTTIELTSLQNLFIKRSNSDNFGKQLKHVCQLFRFYSSVILVIVGKKFS
jgi:hypothetical protein